MYSIYPVYINTLTSYIGQYFGYLLFFFGPKYRYRHQPHKSHIARALISTAWTKVLNKFILTFKRLSALGFIILVKAQGLGGDCSSVYPESCGDSERLSCLLLRHRMVLFRHSSTERTRFHKDIKTFKQNVSNH